MTQTRSLRATVERLERSHAVLDVQGKEVLFPRASLPTPLDEGDVLALTVTVETDGARDAEAARLDEMTGKRVGSRKRGSPRGTPTRAMKK